MTRNVACGKSSFPLAINSARAKQFFILFLIAPYNQGSFSIAFFTVDTQPNDISSKRSAYNISQFDKETQALRSRMKPANKENEVAAIKSVPRLRASQL